jgi:hypothetical protein
MKRLIMMLLACLMPVMAWGAGDTIMFTQLSGKGTANDLWVEMTRVGMESKGIKNRYEVGTCATSLEAWNAAGDRDPALMLYSSNWVRSSLQTGQPCLVKDLDRVTVYVAVRTPWWLCKNRTKSKQFSDKGVTIGYHMSSIPGEDIIADINARNGYQWRGVDTKGSGANLMLLTNGEIDYGFIASNFARRKITEVPGSPLECVASWKPNDTIPYFKDLIKMKGDPTNLLYYTQIIIGKNMTAEQDRQLREIYNIRTNTKFQEWIQEMSNGEYEVPRNSQQYMNQFVTTVKQVMGNYKK